MLHFIREVWHYSTLRFYLKNLIWNYNFWLKSRKVFDETEYRLKDKNGFYTGKTKKIKKFRGFLYRDKLYLDNPGFPIEERDLWTKWRNKGLIK